jgi:hypothetical protein
MVFREVEKLHEQIRKLIQGGHPNPLRPVARTHADQEREHRFRTYELQLQSSELQAVQLNSRDLLHLLDQLIVCNGEPILQRMCRTRLAGEVSDQRRYKRGLALAPALLLGTLV